MANIFSRSWEITKNSFGVILKDKELLLFPILSGFFSLLFVLSMLFPTIIGNLITGVVPELGVIDYVLLFVSYLGLSFIATFFNCCVVYTTKKRFENKNSKFFETLGFAFSKIHLIFFWSLLSATVGVILNVLENLAEKSKGLGRFVLQALVKTLGMAWSIVTLFVIPSLVYKNLSPFSAIKDSIKVLKKTWGESLVKYLGLGLIKGLLIALGIVLLIILIFVVIPLGAVAVISVVAIFVVYLILLGLIFGIADSIFDTALYYYALTGKVPSSYTSEQMKEAFHKKKQ